MSPPPTPLDKHEQLLARTREIERAVLGGILVDPGLYHAAREHVSARDFFSPAHRLVFAGFERLVAKHQPIDLALLAQEFTPEEITEVDIAYLSGLTGGVPRAMNVSYYARKVAEKATLRHLAASAREILVATESGDEDEVGATLEQAERSILAIRDRATRASVVGPADRSAMSFKQVETMIANGGALLGVATGLTELDEELRGLRAEDLITIAARPSMGKTSLLLQFLNAAGATGTPALGFSLESSVASLNLRDVCLRAGVNAWRLQRGEVTPWEQRRLMDAIEEQHHGGVHLIDQAFLTVGKIGAMARRFKAEHGLALVGIDYLQLVTPESGRRERAENRTTELGMMTRTLQQLARDLKVPVVLLSQLSRGPESRDDKRPRLADLRESGSIEQDSDVVLLIHRPNAYPELRAKNQYRDHYAEIWIAKQRNGPTGLVKVAFYRETTSFANWTEEPQTMPKRLDDPALPLEAQG